MYIVGKML